MKKFAFVSWEILWPILVLPTLLSRRSSKPKRLSLHFRNSPISLTPVTFCGFLIIGFTIEILSTIKRCYFYPVCCIIENIIKRTSYLVVKCMNSNSYILHDNRAIYWLLEIIFEGLRNSIWSEPVIALLWCYLVENNCVLLLLWINEFNVLRLTYPLSLV
jgi:hypothetical protein